MCLEPRALAFQHSLEEEEEEEFNSRCPQALLGTVSLDQLRPHSEAQAKCLSSAGDGGIVEARQLCE